MLRTVVEDKSFQKDWEDLCNEYGLNLIEEVKSCVEWNVARNPLRYDAIPGYPHHYVLKTTDIDSDIVPVPSFRVIFRYDDKKDPNRVFLVSIEDIPSTEEED